MLKNISSICLYFFFTFSSSLLGASLDKADYYCRTPLYIASARGHLEIVKVFIGSGALLHKAANNGETPLYIASYYGHLEIVIVIVILCYIF